MRRGRRSSRVDGDVAVGRGNRRGGHDPSPVARERPGRDRPRPGGARRRRAPDRGRSPSLRDRAHLRGGDRRGGRAPLRAHVPGLDVRSGACDLSDPPARGRPRRCAAPAARRSARRRSSSSPRPRPIMSCPRAETATCRPSGCSSEAPRRPAGPGSRHRRSPTARSPVTPRATAASTRPCSRSCSSRTRSACPRTTSPISAASGTRATSTRRGSCSAQASTTLAFLLRPTPVEQVQAIAAAGETMPPKSTYFYPKLLSGLLFNPLG